MTSYTCLHVLRSSGQALLVVQDSGSQGQSQEMNVNVSGSGNRSLSTSKSIKANLEERIRLYNKNPAVRRVGRKQAIQGQ